MHIKQDQDLDMLVISAELGGWGRRLKDLRSVWAARWDPVLRKSKSLNTFPKGREQCRERDNSRRRLSMSTVTGSWKPQILRLLSENGSASAFHHLYVTQQCLIEHPHVTAPVKIRLPLNTQQTERLALWDVLELCFYNLFSPQMIESEDT